MTRRAIAGAALATALAGAAVSGCLRDRGERAGAARETGQTNRGTASAYGPADSGRGQGTHLARAPEAPDAIEAVETTIRRLRADPAHAQENLAPYKQQLGDMVDAMRADLARTGQADSGAFHALSDSVLRGIGGGASAPPNAMSRQDLQRQTAQTERLIARYRAAVPAAVPAASDTAR